MNENDCRNPFFRCQIFFKGSDGMDIKDLEIFRAVVNNKNVTKAANELNYVQSNITNRLLKIEKEIGVSLLIRTNRGVLLTSEGERFLEYADKMLQLHKEVLDDLKDPELLSGHLSIGATDITTVARLPAVITAYLELYPLVDLSIINGSSEELIKEVLKFNLDGAFITDTINQPKILQEKLIEEELVLISNKEHPPINSLKDLKKKNILVFKNGCTYRRKLEAWVKEDGIMARKIEFGTIEGMMGCVKAGLGIALVSKLIAKQLNNDNKMQYHDVPEKYKYVTTVFIKRNDIPSTNALKKFMKTTKECFAEVD